MRQLKRNEVGIGKCSCPGCPENAVVSVGITEEPMCQRHYEAWLEGHKKTMFFVFEQMRKLTPNPKPE